MSLERRSECETWLKKSYDDDDQRFKDAQGSVEYYRYGDAGMGAG